MSNLNPNSLKIGYVILVNTRKPAIAEFQRKAGYGSSSKWTHVAGWTFVLYNTIPWPYTSIA